MCIRDSNQEGASANTERYRYVRLRKALGETFPTPESLAPTLHPTVEISSMKIGPGGWDKNIQYLVYICTFVHGEAMHDMRSMMIAVLLMRVLPIFTEDHINQNQI